ncbi:hypothetical protein D3C79_776630 [compost metagenome]
MKEDAPTRVTHHLRRLDVLLPGHRHGTATGQTDHPRGKGDGHGQHDQPRCTAEHGHDQQHQDQVRKRQRYVRRPADRLVQAPAREPGQQAQAAANQQCEGGCCHRHPQHRQAAAEQPREQVMAQKVVPQRCPVSRWAVHRPDHRRGRMGCQPGAESGQKRHQQGDHGATAHLWVGQPTGFNHGSPPGQGCCARVATRAECRAGYGGSSAPGAPCAAWG